jgi:hypothetical protein
LPLRATVREATIRSQRQSLVLRLKPGVYTPGFNLPSLGDSKVRNFKKRQRGLQLFSSLTFRVTNFMQKAERRPEGGFPFGPLIAFDSDESLPDRSNVRPFYGFRYVKGAFRNDPRPI